MHAEHYLHDGDDVGEPGGVDVHRSEQHKELMSRRVTHKLEIVGRVLVVRRDEERDHALQEGLRCRMVREERIAIDPVQRALGRMRAAGDRGRVRRGVEAQDVVQPTFDRVATRVTDGLIQRNLPQRARRAAAAVAAGCEPPLRGSLGGNQGRAVDSVAGGGARVRAARGGGRRRLACPQLLDELERERAAGALVAVDGRGEEDQVRPEELTNLRHGDGGGLVHDEQFGLRQELVV